MYGIYDTKDNCWIGDDKGPRLFEVEIIAKVAAQVMEDQVGVGPGRYRAVEYSGGEPRLRDEVPVKRTAEEALRRIEEGLV